MNKKVNRRTPSLNDVVKKVANNNSIIEKFNSAIDIMAAQADIRSSTNNIPRLIKPPHKLPKIDAELEISPAFKTLDNARSPPASSPKARESNNFSPISPFDAMTPQKL